MTILRRATPRTPRIIAVSVVFAYAALAYALLFFGTLFSQASVAIGAIILFPVAIGLATQALADPSVTKRVAGIWGTSVLITLVLSVVLLITAVETIICIAMAVPIFLPLQWLGVRLARWAMATIGRKMNKTTLRVSLLVLPLVVPMLGLEVDFPRLDTQEVTDILINASPETVWQHTVEIAEITAGERVPTLSHTLLHAPQPLDAVVDGNLRQLRWTKGVRFQEQITARVENQTLTWLFVFNEQVTLAGFDPHISPNSRELNLTGGSYELTPTANGQTRLRLETRYSVQTPFNPYLKLWGNLFLQDFHTSVLEVIKMRSERSS